MKYSLSLVAPLALLVPLFAMLGGWLFYREKLGLMQLAAAAFIRSGLFVSQRSWQGKTQTTPGKERQRAADVLAGKALVRWVLFFSGACFLALWLFVIGASRHLSVLANFPKIAILNETFSVIAYEIGGV